jgi:zinc/manganese transport system substrate-binding protein
MKRFIPTIAFLGMFGFAAPAHAGVDVVATVPDLAAIAKAIGGNQVNVTALSLPSQDPHFVDAKPSLVLKLHKADLLIAVGLDLEAGWLPSLQTQARNSDIARGGAHFLECAHYVTVLDLSGAKVDRAEGDVHPGGNPHYLYDPRQAAKCALAIGAKLALADPSNAKLYKKNLDRFVADLKKARARWEEKLAPYKAEPVVTYHKSMTYLIDWLGLDEVATLEPKPGIPPTARHVAQVIKTAKAKGAAIVLQESYYPDKTGKLVASKLGGRVVVLPGGADVSSGESYIEHMDRFVDDLASAFEEAAKK